MVELWDNALLRAVENYNSAEGTANPGDVSTQDSAAESQQETLETEPGTEPSKYKNIPDGARSKGRDLSDYLDDEGDVMFEERTFSYDELVAKDDLQGVVIDKTQHPKTINGLVDSSWVVDTVKEKCESVTKKGKTAYYVNVPDIGTNVEIANYGLTHGFDRPNDKKDGKTKPKAVTNARAILEIPQILSNSIEVNRSQRGNNINVPYTHILIGTVAIENDDGTLEYYAVRSMVQERINQEPVLVEADILGKLTSVNAKKIDSPAAWVDESIVARTGGRVYSYSVADLLNDVKGVFDDTFSKDVYKHFGMKRESNDFSKNLLYESRTAELTDEQVIEQRLKNLKETDPEFQKLKRYSKISSKMSRNTREKNRVKRELNKINERLSDKIDTEPEEQQSLNDKAVELRRVLARLQSWYNDMKAERQELYKDSQIEKIIEAERREMSQAAYEEYQKDVDEYRAARNKTETLNKIRRLRNILATMLNANTQKKHVPIPLMETVLNLLSDISDTKAADREITDKLQSFRARQHSCSRSVHPCVFQPLHLHAPWQVNRR